MSQPPSWVIEILNQHPRTCKACREPVAARGVEGCGVRRANTPCGSALFVQYRCPSCARRMLIDLEQATMADLAAFIGGRPETAEPEPAPESVDAEHDVWLDEDEGSAPVRPSIGRDCPDESICDAEVAQFVQRMRHTCFRRDTPGWMGFMRRMGHGDA